MININEIYKVCKSNDIFIIKEKLGLLTLEEKKIILNYQTETSIPILILACINNNLNLLEYLFNEGADLNIKLMYQKILDTNDNNNNRICCNKNTSLLHIACKIKNFNIVKFLINNKVDINAIDIYNSTPLYNICQHFNDAINNNKLYKYKKEDFDEIFQIIKFLLKKGANPHISTISQKKTPLHIIADRLSYRHYEKAIIKELIYYGADLYAHDRDKVTPEMSISKTFIEKIKIEENIRREMSEAIILVLSSKYNLIGKLLINRLKFILN